MAGITNPQAPNFPRARWDSNVTAVSRVLGEAGA